MRDLLSKKIILSHLAAKDRSPLALEKLKQNLNENSHLTKVLLSKFLLCISFCICLLGLPSLEASLRPSHHIKNGDYQFLHMISEENLLKQMESLQIYSFSKNNYDTEIQDFNYFLNRQSKRSDTTFTNLDSAKMEYWIYYYLKKTPSQNSELISDYFDFLQEHKRVHEWKSYKSLQNHLSKMKELDSAQIDFLKRTHFLMEHLIPRFIEASNPRMHWQAKKIVIAFAQADFLWTTKSDFSNSHWQNLLKLYADENFYLAPDKELNNSKEKTTLAQKSYIEFVVSFMFKQNLNQELYRFKLKNVLLAFTIRQQKLINNKLNSNTIKPTDNKDLTNNPLPDMQSTELDALDTYLLNILSNFRDLQRLKKQNEFLYYKTISNRDSSSHSPNSCQKLF